MSLPGGGIISPVSCSPVSCSPVSCSPVSCSPLPSVVAIAWFKLKLFPPPLIIVLVISGLATTPNAKSATVIVEVTRISWCVCDEDIYNSNFMNVCTIYRFIKLLFLIMVTLCFIGNDIGIEIFEDHAGH